ncbi:MAG: prepilin-type N-terminal cleavage/methylation domain-containing protein [Pseudomonadota bacterium]
MTTHYPTRKNQSGFTLVELLIVAIILAILAAIVVPQFASSTDDARAAALRSNLANIRGAVDLYAQQHTATYPGIDASSGGTCTGGVAGSGLAGTVGALTDQLTRYSNATGQTCSLQDYNGDGTPDYPFGPYLKGDNLPTNPVTQVAAVKFETTGDLAMGAQATPGLGWRYDTTSGKFIADDDGLDPAGVAYDTY